MKRIKTITLAIAVLTCSAGSVAAQDTTFRVPEVRGKLDSLVAAKMHKLVQETYVYQGITQVVEYSCERKMLTGTVVTEGIAYDAEENKS